MKVISVPARFKPELDAAIRAAKMAGYASIGRDIYMYIRTNLANLNIKHHEHDHPTNVPSDHAYYNCKG